MKQNVSRVLGVVFASLLPSIAGAASYNGGATDPANTNNLTQTGAPFAMYIVLGLGAVVTGLVAYKLSRKHS